MCRGMIDMSKINSKLTFERFRRSLLQHGISHGLNTLPAIARFLGFEERTFYRRVESLRFSYWELAEIKRRLHYSAEEWAELFG